LLVYDLCLVYAPGPVDRLKGFGSMADEEEDLADVEPDDPDIVELEALEDDDLIDDDEGLDDDDDLAVVDDLVVDDVEDVVPVAVVVAAEDDDDDDDDDEDVDPDDVEAGLDVILKDRLVVVDEQDDDEDEVADTDDRTEGSTKVVPKRPGEFVCQSCFLVKHPSQLADADRMFCRDCV
jgi:hypothetical protein